MLRDRIAKPQEPQHRRLWIYAIDPSAESELAIAPVGRCVLPVRWESLDPGPVGEYVEVVDVDPSSDCVYDPLDLEAAHTIACDGLAPSEGNPQFHQQMVYAVVMRTIENFERALGRPILWAPRQSATGGEEPYSRWDYVQRLRLYPHAMRDENAYYSPDKKAIMFGYFNASVGEGDEDHPGGMVFTCLSPDIIAHETTHAILDGIHPHFFEPTNLDMLAFHEAFADIVAIFQHFTLPGLVLDQIRQTRGDLHLNSLLATLAKQVGDATGGGGPLRNALGRFDEHGRRLAPDPSELARTTECHARGAILVAAVFDAFLSIYSDRIQDLRRIATGGTGVLPKGDIHPDLANRFADEAIKIAERVLTICIRALDYLPPVDITFGDYLRALITADTELVPDDPHRYRVAFIEAFHKRGIFPLDVRAMGEDTLRWKRLEDEEWEKIKDFLPTPDILHTMAATLVSSQVKKLGEDKEYARVVGMWEKGGHSLRKVAKSLDEGRRAFMMAHWLKEDRGGLSPRRLESDKKRHKRENLYDMSQQFSRFFSLWLMHAAWLATANSRRRQLTELREQFGLDFLVPHDSRDPEADTSTERQSERKPKRRSVVEVQDVRPTLRSSPDGHPKVELLVILTQLSMEPLADENGKPILDPHGHEARYHFRGGCSLVIDPETGRVSYVISKQLPEEPEKEKRGVKKKRRVKKSARQQRIEQFLQSRVQDLGDAAFDQYHLRPNEGRPIEPLAILHRTHDDGAC